MENMDRRLTEGYKTSGVLQCGTYENLGQESMVLGEYSC